MTEKLRVAARTGDGKIKLVEQPVPELKAGMVKLSVRASLVSPGTELRGGWRALRAEKDDPKPLENPQAFGYSNAGVVVEVGEGVERFKPGDRVAAVGAGYARHATTAVAPHNLVFPLPENVGFEQGVYAMLAATSLMAVRRHNPKIGESHAAVGLGLVGQIAAQLLQLNGCFVIGWDLVPRRIDIAAKCGISETCLVGDEDAVEKSRAFTGGYGLDGAILSVPGEATKAVKDIEKSLAATPDGHPVGTITIVGGSKFQYDASLTNVDYRRSSRTGAGYHDAAWETGPDYPPVFMRWTTRTNIELCLRLIAEKKLDVDALTTHRVPLVNCEVEIDRLIEEPDEILGLVFKMD